ncbi:MAG: M48 family metallopeptidase [Alphaproteobacteria bacterium]|nr:M48 family metallopeptidase [Alphaproteobacteria bacterium]
MTQESKFFARYSDGKVSKKTIVSLQFFRQGIEIYADKNRNDPLDKWLYEDMRVNHDWTKGIGGSFEHKDRDSAVLDCNQKQVFDLILSRLGKRDRATFIVPISLPVLISLAIISVFVIVSVIPAFSWMMEQAAYLVPQKVEDKIGDLSNKAMDLEFKSCDDETAQKSLQKIMDNLIAHQENKNLHPRILLFSSRTANAFAIPGQNIAVLRGFLKDTRNEGELAGVLAHELGHIEHKDPMKLVMQQQGIKILSAMFVGGTSYSNVADIAVGLSTLSYSRSKELSADAYAKELLQKSGYGTEGIISFLSRMKEQSPDVLQTIEEKLSFLSTHPATAERIKRLKDNRSTKRPEAAKILSAIEFKQLRQACGKQGPLK